MPNNERPVVFLRRLIACGLALSLSFEAHAKEPPAPAKRPLRGLEELSASLEDLAAKVGPAVVQVLATSYATEGGEGSAVLAKQRGSGSGVILSADGYIVTNAHVVQGAGRIQVVLPGPTPTPPRSILRPRGRTVAADLVGTDRETDLAVLRVAEQGLPFLTLGDSEALRQGQLVLAFGSPLGFDNTATMGIVSSVARQLASEGRMIYVQTDAPINPGNSGGPLVDVSGQVVGINTLIASQGGGSEGLGFAAPSNIVRAVYEQIRKEGRVRRAELGMRVQTITPALAGALKLPRREGVVIADVQEGGGAASAGARIGDVVVSLDGKPMENARQLEVNLYRRTPGESVTIEVLRDSERATLQAVVSERSGDTNGLGFLVSPERNLVPRLGILALDLTENVRKMVQPRRSNDGVVVAALTADGPAWNDPPRPGDVIHAINLESVTSVEALKSRVAALRPGDPVGLVVERDGLIVLLAAELE